MKIQQNNRFINYYKKYYRKNISNDLQYVYFKNNHIPKIDVVLYNDILIRSIYLGEIKNLITLYKGDLSYLERSINEYYIGNDLFDSLEMTLYQKKIILFNLGLEFRKELNNYFCALGIEINYKNVMIVDMGKNYNIKYKFYLIRDSVDDIIDNNVESYINEGILMSSNK